MEGISFYAYGHELIKATHKSTFEITKENYLTKRGDCIIAINSSMSCDDLPYRVKRLLKTDDSRAVLIIEVDGLREYVFGYGSSKLILSSSKSMVVRKSTFIDDRTLMINANKAAGDISRRLINRVKNRDKKILFNLVIYPK